MKKNFQEILKLFSELQIRVRSQKFLENFWIDEEDKLNYWELIKNKIFYSTFKHMPDTLFNEEFEQIVQRGGTLFTQEEYLLLQKCMKMAGDMFFVVIENNFVRKKEDDNIPYLQFKFPICTTWEELNNGDENYPDISYDLLWIMDKEFFVFGDSGKWGKYAACDYYDTPIDIIGFKPELAFVFQECFKQSREEQDDIRKWLPPNYRNLIE